MCETTVIVIPCQDNDGNSKKPYITRIEDDFRSYQMLLDDACFDIVRLFRLPGGRFVYAMVDDCGKIKELNANGVLFDYVENEMKSKMFYTLDGTVLLSVIDEYGETSDFLDNEAENILAGLVRSHERVQGKPIRPITCKSCIFDFTF